tara:strand:- start:442 stop:936 length:495 start_codon:yes stop_codon:yes gene_type:complete
MIHTYNLFSINVFQGKIIVPVETHKKILNYVEKNYEEKDLVSCVDGFQYHGDFSGKKELNELINNHMATVYQFKIIHGWLNVLKNKSYNKPHFHTGNDIKASGVMYLSSQNNNINFVRDTDVFEIRPKLFDYLVFPFSLLHYVLPEDRQEARICYAFNLETLRS